MEFSKTLVNLPKSFRRSIRDNVKTKSKGGSSGDDNLSKITYEELVELRDNSKLIPGRKYRIIDYVTTVGEVIGQYVDDKDVEHDYAKYASANHPFDVVVTALDVDKLDEVASCLLHEGDTYFSHVNISAWEIKYCLDNDTNRFEWADPDGKGVIYHMKDDRNNECDYDFKNVLFWRCYVEDGKGNYYYIGLAEVVRGSDTIYMELPAIDRNNYTYIYTFSIRDDNNFYNDASVVTNLNIDYGISCNNNIIKNYIINTIIDGIEYKRSFLPNITIVSINNNYEVYSNVIQNSKNLVFWATLFKSVITGFVQNTYFLKGFENLIVSGNIYNTYLGFSNEYTHFDEYNSVINATIKGTIYSCNILCTNYKCSDFTLDGYIMHTVINIIKYVQFCGIYNNVYFNNIQRSYINAHLNSVNFNHILIDSDIRGHIQNLSFRQTGNDNITVKLKTNIDIVGNKKQIGFTFLEGVPFVNVELLGHESVGLDSNATLPYNDTQHGDNHVTKIVYGICENKEFKLIRRETIAL